MAWERGGLDDCAYPASSFRHARRGGALPPLRSDSRPPPRSDRPPAVRLRPAAHALAGNARVRGRPPRPDAQVRAKAVRREAREAAEAVRGPARPSGLLANFVGAD